MDTIPFDVASEQQAVLAHCGIVGFILDDQRNHNSVGQLDPPREVNDLIPMLSVVVVDSSHYHQQIDVRFRIIVTACFGTKKHNASQIVAIADAQLFDKGQQGSLFVGGQVGQALAGYLACSIQLDDDSHITTLPV